MSVDCDTYVDLLERNEHAECVSYLIDDGVARLVAAGAEVLVIASALSTQDPRVRPPGLESAADLAHAVWFDQKSDFAGLLRIWFDHQERHRADGASAARGARPCLC